MNVDDVDERLKAGAAAGTWDYRGVTVAGNYSIVLGEKGGRRRRSYPPHAMREWLLWFDHGQAPKARAAVSPGDPDRYALVRELLVDPGIGDILKVAIWGAIDAETPKPATLAELARRAGCQRSSAAAALTLGTGALSLDMANRLMVAAAGTWRTQLAAALPTGDGTIAPMDRRRPEPAGLARLRALMLCADNGLLHWQLEDVTRVPYPTNDAFHARRVTITRGRLSRTVGIYHVVPACAGLADAVNPDVALMIV